MSYGSVTKLDEYKTRRDNVIQPFERSDPARTDTAVPQDLLDQIFDSEEFKGRLEAMIEEIVYESDFKRLSSNPPQVDDSFDVMQLGEPDTISKGAISKLRKCAGIQDLSNTISFIDDTEA